MAGTTSVPSLKPSKTGRKQCPATSTPKPSQTSRCRAPVASNPAPLGPQTAVSEAGEAAKIPSTAIQMKVVVPTTAH